MSMSIEVTPALIATAVGWFASSVMATWTLSRRSRLWDETEDVIYVVFGDRKTSVKGLQQKFDDLHKEVLEDHAKMRGLLRALDANAADEQGVEQAVRNKLKLLTPSSATSSPALQPVITSPPSTGEAK